MKEVRFVTPKNEEVNSLKSVFEGRGISVIQIPSELPVPKSDSLKEIARSKAYSAWVLLNEPVVVQATGFFVSSLNGFPKAFVDFALETIGVEGILRLIEGKSRACEFRPYLAYYDGQLDGPHDF